MSSMSGFFSFITFVWPDDENLFVLSKRLDLGIDESGFQILCDVGAQISHCLYDQGQERSYDVLLNQPLFRFLYNQSRVFLRTESFNRVYEALSSCLLLEHLTFQDPDSGEFPEMAQCFWLSDWVEGFIWVADRFKKNPALWSLSSLAELSSAYKNWYQAKLRAQSQQINHVIESLIP